MSLDQAEESILYEILEYFVSKQGPELVKFKDDSVILTNTGKIINAWRYLNNRYSLPEIISQQITHTSAWKFALGDGGKILAVLQESVIEIRKLTDEYSSIVSKTSVPKDFFPQWRKILWSPDGSILVLASSNGYLSFYNSLGSNIFNISPETDHGSSEILEAGAAIVSMIFKKPRVKNEKWDFELITVTYGGLLKSYYVSTSNGFKRMHDFSFTNYYKNGINAIVYSDSHNMLFVAGNRAITGGNFIASEIGLTCWRTLDGSPHYQLGIISRDTNLYKNHFSLWNFVPFRKNQEQSIIFKLSMSPNCQLVACLHTNGTISLWSIPTLRLYRQWKLIEQPNFDEKNINQSVKLHNDIPNNYSEFHPFDIRWWSDHALIIARYSGAVTVCSITNLENLLGTSPEFLSCQPQIAAFSKGGGFLCLDCETRVLSIKRNIDSSADEQIADISNDSEPEDDENESESILNHLVRLLQNILYTMTDIEKFQPKRKKSKIFHKTFKFLGVRKTTPEELYLRKIEVQNYKEALVLAETYKLDKDLVFQTQWRKSDCSFEAINEHLSKVTKQYWVLNECISKVPDTIEATKSLLNFGLEKAQIKSWGDFITKEDDFNETSFDESSEQLERQTIDQIIDNGDPKLLSKAQKSIVRYRKVLLNHLDKLQVYEMLLESPDRFNTTFYEEFRQLSPIENAVRFAKDGNCKGLEIMFTYYGKLLLPHWLPIISLFPETLIPYKYQKLLPKCDENGKVLLFDQQELRQLDWVEQENFKNVKIEEYETLPDSLYGSEPHLQEYRNDHPGEDLLEKWYKNRAYEIEKMSNVSEYALILVRLGKSFNVKGLEKLLFQLETLDDIIYKVGLEETRLAEIETLTEVQKFHLLMAHSTPKNFISKIKTLLLPYTRRKDEYLGQSSKNDLFHSYMKLLSKSGLELVVQFFDYYKTDLDFELLDGIDDATNLAFECLYECSDENMYAESRKIFESLIFHANVSDHKRFKELESELGCMKILNRYGVYITLKVLKENKNNFDETKKLLNHMCDHLSKNNLLAIEREWVQLLNDMLDIQKCIFQSLDVQTCFEIFLSARLRSREMHIIQGSKDLIEPKKGDHAVKVPYRKAVEIVLDESNNYFNNAKSLYDLNMELARECLKLIPDNNSRISEEYDLIESIQILKEFNINILPLQVRLIKDKLKLIEDCLNSKNNAYENKIKLLNLSKYLKIEKKNDKVRLGKVYDLISRKAFAMADYEYCSSLIIEAIRNKYQISWNVAMNLGFCESYANLTNRIIFLWFAITIGPSEVIERALREINLLQVQALKTELNKTITKDEHKDENLNQSTDRESEESKFSKIPTDLVQSSANLIKQSTLQFISTFENTDFWKSKLKTIPTKFGPFKTDDNISIISNEEIQKFPWFYASLHDNCAFSNLSTQYSNYDENKYSLSDLKLSQTLFRMSMLNETAFYGLENADNDLLLLKCAKHYIKEDCLIALSHLFHLTEESHPILDKGVLQSLRNNKLETQIYIYYLSVKLYMKLVRDSSNVFSFDPAKLVSAMSRINVPHELNFLKEKIDILVQNEKSLDMDIATNDEKNFKLSKFLDDLNNEHEISNWDDGGDWNDVNLNADDLISQSFEAKSNRNIGVSKCGAGDAFDVLDHLIAADNNNEDIFYHVKNCTKNEPLDRNHLIQFIEDKKEKLSPNHILFLKIISKNLDLQMEAVNDIKDNYKKRNINNAVLREIFFNDLTMRFDVGHEMYHRILEEVLTNYSVDEIKSNVQSLVDELFKRGNVPYAIALKNYTENIPAFFSTYSSCLESLLEDK